MKVLVIGGGGREHALCSAIAASPRLTQLYCAPGNAGIAQVASCLPDVGAENLEAILAACDRLAIDLVVVGPEAPLVVGLVDRLRAAGIAAVGPTAAAARLEGSKGFMKDVLVEAGVPTAAYGRFSDATAAKTWIKAQGNRSLVVKADGLAAGKGVILCDTEGEALAAVDHMMGDRAFGAAGDEVVVEERLRGEEASVFALCDGETAVWMGAAQDHKQVGDGDTGPNTGGMGAYAPAPIIDPAMARLVMERIIQPTVDTMARRGTPFTGILFGGLIIEDGEPKVLEFNVRFGDPECQVLMARLDSDLLDLLEGAATGRLAEVDPPRWRDEAALVVVMAARGYPGAYEKGTVIGGLEAAGAIDGVTVFHAGTRTGADGTILANGGRVLGVTATGETVTQAQARAYAAVDHLDWPAGFCRRDIGWRAIARERNAPPALDA